MAIAGCSQVAAKKSVYSRNPRETLSKEFQCHKARLHAQSGHASVTKGASTFPSSRGSSAMDFFVVFLRQLSLDGRQCVGSGCQEFTVFSGTQRDFEQDVPVPQARLHTHRVGMPV